jgi:hypothetical protein
VGRRAALAGRLEGRLPGWAAGAAASWRWRAALAAGGTGLGLFGLKAGGWKTTPAVGTGTRGGDTLVKTEAERREFGAWDDTTWTSTRAR